MLYPCTSLKTGGILVRMPSVEPEGQAARRELERVLASPGFSRNERLSRFLRFVVERHLGGHDQELKESVIAIEVFGRAPGYDPKRDPIVRTEASRLRARLDEYYLGDGKGDQLAIDLPKGGYIPAFRAVADVHIDSRPNPPRYIRPLFAGLAVLLVIASAFGWWRLHSRRPIAIAVLPLDNLSHDPANDYFADGLTDELIRNLSLIEGLAPRSRTSSFAFKGKRLNVQDVARELGVEYILEGSVLRDGQRLRIDAQLIRARDDFPIWSGKFDRELTDVFAIQEDISRGIVNNLRLNLGQGRRRYETSVDAYDAYLRAQTLVSQQGLPSYLQGVALFEEAIVKDPAFAPAYAGEAAAYAAMSGTFPRLESQKDVLARMRAAADKAIELDPLSAEAQEAMASAYARDGRWKESERSFRRSLQLDPNRSTTHANFATNLLVVLGRVDEALREMRIAEKSDPLSPEIQFYLAYVLTSARQYEEAASHCEKLPSEFASNPECLGRARLGQGRIGEALEILAPLRDHGNRGYLGYAYARAGRLEDAEKLKAEIAPNPFNEALVSAGLSDRQGTLEALNRMAVLGPVRMGRALTFPEFAFLRDDPRTRALRKKVGLPD